MDREVEQWEFDSLSDTTSGSSTVPSSLSGPEGDADGAAIEDKLDRIELDSLSESSASEADEGSSAGDSSCPSLVERDYLESEDSGTEHQKDGQDDAIGTEEVHHASPNDTGQERDAEDAQPPTSGQNILVEVQARLAAAEGSEQTAPKASLQAATPVHLDDALPQLESITNPPEPGRTPDSNNLFMVDDAPIWQRTRARNPLTDKTLEELEALLQDDVLDSDDDDIAYQEFLKALAGDSSAEAALLPEEEEEDDDFMLDLDDLLDAGEDVRQPMPTKSPLQTRNGRTSEEEAEAAEGVQWVPQALPPEAAESYQAQQRDKQRQEPLAPTTRMRSQRTRSAGRRGGWRSRGRGRNASNKQPVVWDRSRSCALLASPSALNAGASSISFELQDFARAQADAVREHLELRAQYLEWKRAERKDKIAKRRKMMRAQNAEEPVSPTSERGVEQQQQRKRARSSTFSHPQRRTQRQIRQPTATRGDSACVGQGREGREEINAAEGGSQAERNGAHGTGRAAPETRAAENANQELLNRQDPGGAAEIPSVTAPGAGQEDRTAPLSARVPRLLVAGPTAPIAAGLPRDPQKLLSARQPKSAAKWTLHQLGLFRRQVGQHLHLLCHSYALQRSGGTDGETAGQTRALLLQMQSFCQQATGLRELQGGEHLPPAVTQPLDQSCPKAPLQGPVKCLLAVPILPKIQPFLASVDEHAAEPQADPAAAPRLTALKEIAPYMSQRIVLELSAGKGGSQRGWTPGEKQLLRMGMQRFGTKLDLVQKYFLPTKSIESIRGYVKVEQDKQCPMQKRPEPPPLTAAELAVVRGAIKDRRGGADVWDVLAETRLPHRRAEELRQLYWKQGYKAGRRWETCADSASGTLPPTLGTAGARMQNAAPIILRPQSNSGSLHQAANAKSFAELRLQAELLARGTGAFAQLNTGDAGSQSLAHPQLQAAREPTLTSRALASGQLSTRPQADQHRPGDAAGAGNPAGQQNSQPAPQEVSGQQPPQPRRFIQVGAAQLRHVRALHSRAAGGRSELARQVPKPHSLGGYPGRGGCAAKMPQTLDGAPGKRSRAAELRAKLMASLEAD